MSDFTRRGFFGFLAATPLAAALPFKMKPPSSPLKKMLAEAHANDVDRAFLFDCRTGPPFEAGDVVMLNDNPVPYLIKAKKQKPETLFGMRGTGVMAPRPPDLILVPFYDQGSAQCIPMHLLNQRDIVRVGTAYDEGQTTP